MTAEEESNKVVITAPTKILLKVLDVNFWIQ